MKYVSTIFAFLVLLSACQTMKPIAPTGLSIAAFWKDQKAREASLSAVSGKLSLTLQGKEGSVSGRGKFLIDYPKGFFLELRDPLGRLHFQLIGWMPILFVEYPRENRAFEDRRSGKEYLNRAIGVPISIDDCVRAWWGVLPSTVSHASVVDWEWNGKGEYETQLPTKDGKAKIAVDGITAALKSIELPTPKGTVRVTYDDFDKLGEWHLGHQVKFEPGYSSSKIEVEWAEIDVLSKKPERDRFKWAPGKETRLERLN